MALGVSPERVREVRFAEQWRGYRTDEVDAFVEQVAEAFDLLETRLRESTARATEAERRLLERGPDEDLSRTLVLAQRTADAARREAEVEAERLVHDAEERARLLMEESEGRRRQLDEEIESRLESQLRDVADRRAKLEDDVASLASFVEHERRRLADELREQLAWLERAGSLEPPTPPLLSPAPGALASSGLSAVLADVDAERSEPSGSVPWDAMGDADYRGDATVALGDLAAVRGFAADNNMADDIVARQDPALLGPSRLDDGMALDDLDLPWRRSDDDDRDDEVDAGDGLDLEPKAIEPEAIEPEDDAVTSDDDPFFAELRRAVNDPEPLGPRDDAGDASEWSDESDLYGESKSSARFRRRRQR